MAATVMDVRVPQCQEDTVEVITVSPQWRIFRANFRASEKKLVQVVQIMNVCTSEQIVHVPGRQFQEIVEVSSAISPERKFESIKEYIVKVVQIMDVCTEEQLVNMPVLQLQETSMLNPGLNKS